MVGIVVYKLHRIKRTVRVNIILQEVFHQCGRDFRLVQLRDSLRNLPSITKLSKPGRKLTKESSDAPLESTSVSLSETCSSQKFPVTAQKGSDEGTTVDSQRCAAPVEGEVRPMRLSIERAGIADFSVFIIVVKNPMKYRGLFGMQQENSIICGLLNLSLDPSIGSKTPYKSGPTRLDRSSVPPRDDLAERLDGRFISTKIKEDFVINPITRFVHRSSPAQMNPFDSVITRRNPSKRGRNERKCRWSLDMVPTFSSLV